uniref:Uncharacterized protein LOC101513188 isoform X2 n=1 Tax=Cicer arietinum TaxID=3827 RepID=A0A3Q7XUM4_CICAR|nr:uncharacterized protein LOC101513188 isoform X2 [Cicer arietinum]
MMLCGSFCLNLRDRIQPWLRDYDALQSFAVILIYIQIGCGLIGSLGASYNGVSLINLAIALFALVAIESSSQSLGRTYAFLLFCSILLDVSWFILFTHEIWNISSQDYATFFIFSVKLTLASRAADFDLRSSFLSPVTPAVVRQTSDSNEILGGSIYDPAYYSSLFEDSQENKSTCGMPNHDIAQNGSTSATEVSQKTFVETSFQAVDIGRECINQEGTCLK